MGRKKYGGVAEHTNGSGVSEERAEKRRGGGKPQAHTRFAKIGRTIKEIGERNNVVIESC